MAPEIWHPSINTVKWDSLCLQTRLFRRKWSPWVSAEEIVSQALAAGEFQEEVVGPAAHKPQNFAGGANRLLCGRTSKASLHKLPRVCSANCNSVEEPAVLSSLAEFCAGTNCPCGKNQSSSSTSPEFVSAPKASSALGPLLQKPETYSRSSSSRAPASF